MAIIKVSVGKNILMPQLLDLPCSSCKDFSGFILCLILQLHYEYPRAFFADVASNYWPLMVHAYFALELALSHKAYFISFSAAVAKVILPIVGKSKMLTNSEFLSFIDAYKKWKQFDAQFLSVFSWEKNLASRRNAAVLYTPQLLDKKKTSMSAVSQPQLVYDKQLHTDRTEWYSKLATEYVKVLKHLTPGLWSRDSNFKLRHLKFLAPGPAPTFKSFWPLNELVHWILKTIVWASPAGDSPVSTI